MPFSPSVNKSKTRPLLQMSGVQRRKITIARVSMLIVSSSTGKLWPDLCCSVTTWDAIPIKLRCNNLMLPTTIHLFKSAVPIVIQNTMIRLKRKWIRLKHCEFDDICRFVLCLKVYVKRKCNWRNFFIVVNKWSTYGSFNEY